MYLKCLFCVLVVNTDTNADLGAGHYTKSNSTLKVCHRKLSFRKFSFSFIGAKIVNLFC